MFLELNNLKSHVDLVKPFQFRNGVLKKVQNKMSIKQNDKDLHEESTVMTYSNADLKEGYLPYEMPKHIYGYSAGLGFECTKRNNLIEMEPYVLLTSAGNVLQFIGTFFF